MKPILIELTLNNWLLHYDLYIKGQENRNKKASFFSL